jgi:hypothetical protein
VISDIQHEVRKNKKHSIRHRESLDHHWRHISELTETMKELKSLHLSRLAALEDAVVVLGAELNTKVTTLEDRIDAFTERFGQGILMFGQNILEQPPTPSPAVTTKAKASPAASTPLVVPPATSTTPVKAPPVSTSMTAGPPLAMKMPPPSKPPAISLLPKAHIVKPPMSKPPPPPMIPAPKAAKPKGPPPQLPGEEAPPSIARSSTGAAPLGSSPRIVTRSSTGSS